MTAIVSSDIRTDWHKEELMAGVVKERLGNKAFFAWCCEKRMRRILQYQKTDDGKIVRLGTGIPFAVGWHCEVCGKRKEKKEIPGM